MKLWNLKSLSKEFQDSLLVSPLELQTLLELSSSIDDICLYGTS